MCQCCQRESSRGNPRQVAAEILVVPHVIYECGAVLHVHYITCTWTTGNSFSFFLLEVKEEERRQQNAFASL